jgi:hypothetical protein
MVVLFMKKRMSALNAKGLVWSVTAAAGQAA